jgi:putative membrane protein
MPGPLVGQILIFIIGLQHLGFAVLEMFLWTKPVGRKIFRTDEAFAKNSRVLAANQGLYNVFLAAGLLISFFLPTESAHYFRLFFLSCVAAAGIFGGFTVSGRLAMIQAGPALFALFFYILGI